MDDTLAEGLGNGFRTALHVEFLINIFEVSADGFYRNTYWMAKHPVGVLLTAFGATPQFLKAQITTAVNAGFPFTVVEFAGFGSFALPTTLAGAIRCA